MICGEAGFIEVKSLGGGAGGGDLGICCGLLIQPCSSFVALLALGVAERVWDWGLCSDILRPGGRTQLWPRE